MREYIKKSLRYSLEFSACDQDTLAKRRFALALATLTFSGLTLYSLFVQWLPSWAFWAAITLFLFVAWRSLVWYGHLCDLKKPRSLVRLRQLGEECSEVSVHLKSINSIGRRFVLADLLWAESRVREENIRREASEIRRKYPSNHCRAG